MDIILKEIVAIIKEETENISKKIYGTTFLEILKEKILNKQDQISLKNLVIQNSNIDLEENIDRKKLNLNVICCGQLFIYKVTFLALCLLKDLCKKLANLRQNESLFKIFN